MATITYCDTSSPGLTDFCRTMTKGNASASDVCKQVFCQLENGADSLTGYTWGLAKGTYNFLQPELGQLRQSLRQDLLVDTVATLGDVDAALTTVASEARGTVIGAALFIFVPMAILFLVVLSIMVLVGQIDVITFVIGVALVIVIATLAILFLLAYLEQRTTIIETTTVGPLRKLAQGFRTLLTDVKTGVETLEQKLATPAGFLEWANSVATIIQPQ